jgi:type VI secretion system protein VasG
MGILRAFGISKPKLAADLNHSLDKLKSGNARTPAFSPTLLDMIREAWVEGSLEFQAAEVRSGFTLIALMSRDDLSRIAREASRELQKIDPDTLRKEFAKITATSGERTSLAGPGSTGPFADDSGEPHPAGGKSKHLDQFTIDLTANARAGKIDPVLGRDFEIRQIVDILTRRRQNNPILTGEAGVGKTAVVEGFALRVVAGDVPEVLRNVVIRRLDLALLQAGAGVKGEFENRLKGLIEEVKNSPVPIILFIDEAHTMIGAGGAAGQGDAANLLKPALARGELRTIAATTWSEYKKYFEKDPALARRFQVIKVEEPSEDQCRVMLRGIVPALEQHHNVRILDEGLAAAVKFSHRYLPDRQLPDKAVSVLDTACARLSLGQSSTPAAVEDAVRRIDDLAVQTRVLERESALGADHTERLQKIAAEKAKVEGELKTMQARWETERDLVTRIRDIRGKAGGGRSGAGNCCAPCGRGSRNRSRARASRSGSDAGRTRGIERRARRVAGRIAADPHLRGCAYRGRRGIGMDRDSDRQDAARRDFDRACSGRSPGQTRHRAESRARRD